MGYYEFNVELAVEARDALLGLATGSGCLGVIEKEKGLIFYYPDRAGIDKLTSDFVVFKNILKDSGLPCDMVFSYEYIAERDWNESWKKKFQPIDIGENISIIPPWELSREKRINLIIDPGMAFGTGHHDTTRTCIELIAKISSQGTKDRFLDVGTGTGILTICAMKLGFREAVGVDIDPLAIDAAMRNIALNGLKNVTIKEGTILAAAGAFDVIAANLMSEILIAIAPEIATRLKKDGIVILSGMIIGQEEEVIAAMEKEGLHFRDKFYDGIRWVTMVLTR
ncbi:MAG TPA: 50S ribosomal protein L11 methyltransferase [Dissulfurispiraceae bacterium]|nr:50S ribosomal protein L11 methyltransferase [Dissulfurispiraceae bacterium]